MSKKADKRKHERRRQHQGAQSRARREYFRQADEAAEQAFRLLGDIANAALDPSVSADDFAEMVGAAFGDRVVAGVLGQPKAAVRYVESWGPELPEERARLLTEALASRRWKDARYGWLAAAVAKCAGRGADAEQLLTAALAVPDLGGGDDVRSGLTCLLVGLRVEAGRVVDALELLEAACRDDPLHERLQDLRAATLEAVYARARGTEVAPTDSCTCGSERGYGVCCRPREEAAIERFFDRSLLYALRAAVADYVEADAALPDWQASHLAEQLEIAKEWAGAGPFDVADHDQLEQLLGEASWLLGPHGADGDVDEDDDRDCVLGRLAADAATAPEIASAAEAWLAHARYGLWQVEDPAAAPGIWLTDLLTRRRVYAALAPEQTDGLGRWSVLLGGLFPVEGVWRTGGAFSVLDPATGDELTAEAQEFANHVAYGLAKERGLKGVRRPGRRGPEEEAPPYGVASALLEPVDDDVADIHHKVVGASLAELLGIALASQRSLPRLTNTDREPMELLTATLPVDDPSALRATLTRRPDFDEDEGAEEPTVVWRGREMTPAEAESSLAEFRAMAAENGWGDVDEAGDEPRYWVRGFLRFRDDRVVIEVNSRARLDSALAVLRRCGATAEPIVERRVDPAMDLLPAGWRPVMRVGSPEAEATWRRHWLDERVPALAGMTPRQAIADAKGRVRLERLLRQFEYDADRARAADDRGMDVDRLRQELGMKEGITTLD